MTPARRLLVPEILSDRPVSADVLVGPQTLTVSVWMPQIPDCDLDVVLTRNSIRLRHKNDPRSLSFVIPLPVACEPERYVLVRRNGLLDFCVARASR